MKSSCFGPVSSWDLSWHLVVLLLLMRGLGKTTFPSLLCCIPSQRFINLLTLPLCPSKACLSSRGLSLTLGEDSSAKL